VTCPRCRSDNRPGIKFCEECGARLALACPSCGAEVLPDRKFCGSCGGALAEKPADRAASPRAYTPKHLAEKILVSKSALEGERKQVTVLFADLKGSMELLANRDPEEARRLLDPVLERMMEAVHRYEGTVNQVMGDGIMALFGAPLAHEDHAVRACYAALRMQETVGGYAEELRRTQGLDVQIRVGLNSGAVVVRSIGNDLHMDYTAVGQTTHLAARLEQLARPGTTLMTADTLRLAEGYVEVNPLGPVPVKGLADAVQVYEIVRAGPVRSRLQAAAARGLSPFVGRDGEIDVLRQSLEPVQAGHGQIETQVLAGERGVHRLAKALTTIEVPATVQAVIASRIDRLAPEERRLLHAASVIGKDVPLVLLRAVADLPEEALSQSLMRLQAAEFLYETGLYPDLGYTFTHALTHDVAYGTLLQDRRRGLHAQILRTIERLHPTRHAEQAEVLADHAFRGEAWDTAVTHLRKAGAKAAARSANVEAVVYLERALTALGKLPESRETTEQGIDVRLELRPPLLQLGHLPKVLAVSQQAENMAKLIGDEARLARVYSYLINYHYLKGEPEMAIAYGERCLAIGEAGADAALQAMARGYMGYSYHAQGQYREAEAVLARNVEKLEALRAAEGAGPQSAISYVSSSGWFAFTLAELGDFDQARTYADMAERAAEAERHAYAQAIAWSLGGLVALQRGHLDRALHLLEKSLETCRSKQLTVWQPIPSSLLGLTQVLLGRHDEGLSLLEDGVARTEALGVKAYLALWTAQLGEGLVAAGQPSRAFAAGEQALSLAIAHKERGHQARALRLLGEVALRSDPPDLAKAEQDFAQALALAEELGMRPLVGRIRLGLGQLHLERGDRAQAEDHLIAALALLRALDMRFFLAQATSELKRLGHIFVVAHHNLGLYEFLKEKFAGDGEVTVILDRRRSERRGDGQPSAAERGRAERRYPGSGDGALRLRGLVVLPGEAGSPPARS